MGARRPGPGGTPNSLEGEGGSEDERVGGGGRAGEAGPGAAPTRMGPWNRKERPSRSGSGSEARSSCCPRKTEGNCVYCWARGHLTGNQGREDKLSVTQLFITK